MITCLNPGTIGGGVSYEEFVELARRTNFQAVEFGIEPLATMAQQKGLDETRSWLAEKGVAHAAFWLPVPWTGDEAAFQDGLKRLPSLAFIAKEVHCHSCITYIPPAVNEDPEGFLERAAKRFQAVCDVLADFGIRFGIEWVAPAHHREKGQPTLWRMDQALQLCERISRKNVGLLVDSYHWFCAEHTVEDLLRLTKDQVVHCHINDAPDRPVEQQRDNDRLLPGDGIIDLKAFLKALKQIGYDGAVSVEVLSERLPKEKSKEELARLSSVALKRLLEEVAS
ncbi:MAG: sugar phosphate isomerase/epimerase [Armatimonadetes bacterium]|nr:sugar phosphate isomerase/epimerase [Armatimonadota bacterium]MDW8120729.1 sugar phosphate isomerase/epimerase family protein [Armatimonadota bacterium]